MCSNSEIKQFATKFSDKKIIAIQGLGFDEDITSVKESQNAPVESAEDAAEERKRSMAKGDESEIAIKNVLRTKEYDPDPSDGPGGPKDFMFLLKQHLSDENIQIKLHDFYTEDDLRWSKKIPVDKYGGKELDLRFDSEKWEWETEAEDQWFTFIGRHAKTEKDRKRKIQRTEKTGLKHS